MLQLWNTTETGFCKSGTYLYIYAACLVYMTIFTSLTLTVGRLWSALVLVGMWKRTTWNVSSSATAFCHGHMPFLLAKVAGCGKQLLSV